MAERAAGTVVAVGVQGVGAADGHVVQQAEAVAAVGVVLAADHPRGAGVVPWRPHSAESVPGLRMGSSLNHLDMLSPAPKPKRL